MSHSSHSLAGQSLGISWVLSTISGYGIYGIQTALQFLRRGGEQMILGQAPSVVALPPLPELALSPAFQLGHKLQAFRDQNPEELLMFRHPVLHGSSSNFAGFAGQDKVWGAPNVCCAAIEQLYTTDHGMKIAKNYDRFIAISQWNADFLRSLNVGPVDLCYQGIDPVLFQPGPRYNLHPNRFVIFSGGKFEFRKGQDIVIAAFKRFRQKHPDALLITCWQNVLMPEGEAFARTGYIDGVPEAAMSNGVQHGLQMTPWLLKQGLPRDSFIDLPFVHNQLMPSVLRECDIAIFPNRCEGGTNLVAMECMASGVPTYVAYNTGQKDLVDLIGCEALRTQRPVTPSSDMVTTQDWGETNIDEMVAALEHVYTNRSSAQGKAAAVAARMKDWEWPALNDKLLDVVFAGGSRA